jgi:phenylalanyl-tRNA synthetase beta chain
MNNSLTSVKDETDAVKLLNPLSGDLAFMRKSLLEGLFKCNLQYQQKNQDIKFLNSEKSIIKKIIRRKKAIGYFVSGRDVAENWLQPKSATSFYTLKLM